MKNIIFENPRVAKRVEEVSGGDTLYVFASDDRKEWYVQFTDDKQVERKLSIPVALLRQQLNCSEADLKSTTIFTQPVIEGFFGFIEKYLFPLHELDWCEFAPATFLSDDLMDLHRKFFEQGKSVELLLKKLAKQPPAAIEAIKRRPALLFLGENADDVERMKLAFQQQNGLFFFVHFANADKTELRITCFQDGKSLSLRPGADFTTLELKEGVVDVQQIKDQLLITLDELAQSIEATRVRRIEDANREFQGQLDQFRKANPKAEHGVANLQSNYAQSVLMVISRANRALMANNGSLRRQNGAFRRELVGLKQDLADVAQQIGDDQAAEGDDLISLLSMGTNITAVTARTNGTAKTDGSTAIIQKLESILSPFALFAITQLLRVVAKQGRTMEPAQHVAVYRFVVSILELACATSADTLIEKALVDAQATIFKGNVAVQAQLESIAANKTHSREPKSISKVSDYWKTAGQVCIAFEPKVNSAEGKKVFLDARGLFKNKYDEAKKQDTTASALASALTMS